MKVLIIGVMYEPDLGPSAPLFTLLSQGLVRRGHQVTVITTVPHYPSGRVPARFRGKWFWRSREDDVDIIRIGLPSIDRANLPQRFLQKIAYALGATLAGMSQQYDVVLSGSPALSVWLPFAGLVAFRAKPAVYSVHDVYPDVGIKLGVFKHKPVIAAVAALERFCLKQARIVHIISESFRSGLRAHGVPDSKMALVYLWVDTQLVHPASRDNLFAREYGLTGHFVVSYAGNIGLSQGLESILDAAELLAEHREIRFVFVGDGSGRVSLEKQAQQRHLSNIQFIPFQPRERLASVLASADVSLVILRRGFGSDSLPSKTFSIMASGRPILVSVDEESETKKLVEQAEAGVWVPPEDAPKLAEAILALKNDQELRQKLGCNGRIWAEQHHSPEYAAQQFEKLLLEAVASKRKF